MDWNDFNKNRSDCKLCTYWEDAVREFYRIQKVRYVNKKIMHKNQRIKKIQYITVYSLNKKDQLEIHVHINHHRLKKVNIQIDQQFLIDKGIMKRRGALNQAQSWFRQNKQFVVDVIDKQIPTFW